MWKRVYGKQISHRNAARLDFCPFCGSDFPETLYEFDADDDGGYCWGPITDNPETVYCCDRRELVSTSDTPDTLIDIVWY